MNEFEPNPSSEEFLDRAIGAFRAQPAPQGPADDVHTQALAAARAAAANDAHKESLIWRIITMPALPKIAAAIVVLVGGLSAWMTAAFFGASPSVSYAQVAEQIRAARTLTYTVTVSAEGKPMVMKQLVSGSVVRSETPGAPVLILYTSGAETEALMLDDTNKTARLMVMRRDNPSPGGTSIDAGARVFESFRALADQPGDAIEDREINGIKAKGFKVKGNNPSSVWVNPATKLPLFVEYHMTSAGKPVTVTMSDFVFDVPLDESLFSLVPPAGYTVTHMPTTTLHLDLETNVITLLKGYAGLKNGRFPKHLDDWGDFAVLISTQNAGNPSPEQQEMMTSAGALTALLSSQQKGKDYDYIPGDAKLGDSDKVVFWYQKEGVCHAIYADLHTGIVGKAPIPMSK